MTVLVGSLPCQLPVEGKRSRRQEPNHHMEEQMLQASSNTPDGRAKLATVNVSRRKGDHWAWVLSRAKSVRSTTRKQEWV
jgi:hypothetical protein